MYSDIRSAFAQPTQPTIIASIQHATITIGTGATSNTATISSVNTGRTRLYGSASVSGDVTPDKACARWELTNATTVTAYRNTSDGTHTVTVSVCIVEYIDGVITAMNRGTQVMLNGGGSEAIALGNSIGSIYELGWVGATGTYSSDNNTDHTICRLLYNSATSIQMSRFGWTGDTTGGYEAVGYSSTYMLSGTTRDRTVATNATLNVFGPLGSIILDNQHFASISGDRGSANTTYDTDRKALTGWQGRVVFVERATASATGVSAFGCNVMQWQPGIMRQRAISSRNTITNGNSSASAVYSGINDASKVMVNYLGFKPQGSYTKTSASLANVLCRVSFNGTDTVTLTRGGSTGDNAPCYGIWEFY